MKCIKITAFYPNAETKKKKFFVLYKKNKPVIVIEKKKGASPNLYKNLFSVAESEEIGQAMLSALSFPKSHHMYAKNTTDILKRITDRLEVKDGLENGYCIRLLSDLYNTLPKWGYKKIDRIARFCDIQYVRVGKEGFFEIYKSFDPSFPGVDIEYFSKPKPKEMTLPRVLFEYPQEEGLNDLRLMIWGDKDKEDPVKTIKFKSGKVIED